MQDCVGAVPFDWLGGHPIAECSAGAWFDTASREQIVRYQSEQLGRLLRFAAAEIPAYRYLKNEVERLPPFDALKAFPLIDKETVQADLQRFLPRNFARTHVYKVTTGGTSGNQLDVYWDNQSQSREMAYIHRFMAQAGYKRRFRKATFRGVSFPDFPPGVFWYRNPIHNEMRFSPFHMTADNLPLYVDKLIDYQPQFLHGYPSAISILADFVLREDLTGRLPDIRAVFLTSEACTQMQRERIEAAFETRVSSWYGHSEGLVFAGECTQSSTYHIAPDYGVLELVDDNGDLRDAEGSQGEIVATGLENYALPLIRYRTGDFATRLASACACGRNWDRMDKVQGRWRQEAVVSKGGGKIALTALNMHGSFFDNVRRYQYYEDTPGKCVIRIMPVPGFTEADRQSIEIAYNNKTKDEVEFRAQVVESIPLTARGKLRLLESHLEQAVDD
ncbi:hypothetical protein SAOR_10515 [Salinisphaera orenii MK-B5]|uniref:Capsular polysaccharide biosynthesis protein CapK n=2 Tax=Salinisphaera TaxID=180541 RepID=A0A423PLI8_9GAMM|nr:hypothetical protein SAOR_10515 [Salinisphaera orenii MK-B5]